MKNLGIGICALLLLASCKENAEETNSTGISSETTPDETEAPAKLVADNTITAHKLVDDKNNVMAIMPLPASWVVNTEAGKPAISGPGGIRVYLLPMKSFTYSDDPMMRQIYAKNGAKMRNFVPISTLIKQDILPIAAKEDSKFVRSYEIPEIAATDKSFSDMLFHVAPPNDRYYAAVTEWIDKKGNPYMILVHENVTYMETMVTWNYSCHAMESSKENYEMAKKQLLSGLSKMKYNPAFVAPYNQQESMKAQSSWAAHNNRMRQNQRNFDNWMQNQRETSKAVNDASMAAYRSADAASDRNQNRFLNYIKDENTVIQGSTGTRYQVETGSTHYWINSNGEYIQSNDPNYDPNRDQNVNNQQWEQTQIQN